MKGLTPNEQQFAALVAYLQRKDISEIYARHDIGAEYPDGRAFAERAAGMLVVPLSRPAGDYLVFFRKEVARAVNWAGDPSKPVTVGPLGARLTPRKSFELWKETVSGQAQHWLPVECRIAEALRVSLLEVILRLSRLTEAERRRAQERQELLIAELNHRVRNILSLIRGVITQSRDPPPASKASPRSSADAFMHWHARMTRSRPTTGGQPLPSLVSRGWRLPGRQGEPCRRQRPGHSARAAGFHHGRVGDS